jgi:hypothetical protein
MRGLLGRLLGRPARGPGDWRRPSRDSAVYAFDLEDGSAVAGTLRRISPGGDFGQAAVAPDGSRAACWGVAAGAAPVPRVWVSSLEGADAPACLTVGPGVQGHPAWYPDGKHLVCFDSEADSWDPRRQFDLGRPPARLIRIDTRSGAIHALTSGRYTDERPAVAPDGSRVVFVSNRSGRMNLWQVDADGSALRQITGGPGPDYRPALSPDGARLAWFTRSARGAHEVRILDLARGVELDCPWNERFDWCHGPWWLDGGAGLLVHARLRGAARPSLWRVDLAGGEARPFATPGLAGASHGVTDAAQRRLVCDSREPPAAAS